MRRNGSRVKVGVSNKRDIDGESSSLDHIKSGVRGQDGYATVKVKKETRSHKSGDRIFIDNDRTLPRLENIFPRWLPWMLFPLTLLLRVQYIQEPTNWWILHPDEIFQTVEVAHSDVFGYGFRPYEYLAPPSENVANSTILSAANAYKIHFGMFSLRSFILPKLIANVLRIAHWCGVKSSSFMVVKVFHTTITSLLPVAIFQFSQTLHQSRDIGCLSAILVSSSLTLNVLGTHTLINSFLAPLIFLCLTHLVSSLNSFKDICEKKQIEIQCVSNDTCIEDAENDSDSGISENSKNNENDQLTLAHSPSAFTLESKPNISSHDENANIILNENQFVDKNVVLTKSWIFINYKNMCDTFHECFSQSKKNCTETQTIKGMPEMFVGIGIAICIYIRFDLVLIPVLMMLGFYSLILTNILLSMIYFRYYITGIFLGALIGGCCDYITYGKWFLAPYQWYKFNVLNNYAGKIFGINSFEFYLLKLYQNEPLITVTFFILLIDILYTVSCTLTMSKKYYVRAHNQSIVTFTFLLLAFCFKTHKELRFIHNVVIFIYISVSVAIFYIVNQFAKNQKYRKYFNYFIYLFIALFTSSHYYNFVNMRIADRTKWTYGDITDSHETNMCLDFIRKQNDVNGVFMDRSVYMSGAYSLLQHDVPIFALNIFEFMEYRKESSQDEGLSFQQKETFSTFTDISDFISVYNSKYMYKKIRYTQEYNFLILRTDNNFKTKGYIEEYRVGNSKVLKRIMNAKGSDFATGKEISNEKIVWNATVLEYEGDWLRHYGVYIKAEQRLLMANRLDPRRIGTFRVLLEMYAKLRQTDDYRNVLKACQQIYRKAECLKPYDPIVLHPSYYRKKS